MSDKELKSCPIVTLRELIVRKFNKSQHFAPSEMNLIHSLLDAIELSELEKDWIEYCPTDDPGYDLVNSRDVTELKKIEGLQKWRPDSRSWINLTPTLGDGAIYFRRPKAPEWKVGDVIWYKQGKEEVAMIIYQGGKFQLFDMIEGVTAIGLFDSIAELVNHYKPLKGVCNAELLNLVADSAKEATNAKE